MSHTKVLFKYNEAPDGSYEVESMWASETNGNYAIDNIPFFAREIALGDVVTAKPDLDGALCYEGLAQPSGHSTIRLWFDRAEDVQKVRDELRAMGCESELSDLPQLVALDVPPLVGYESIRKYLECGETNKIFEFEEACLGQKSP